MRGDRHGLVGLASRQAADRQLTVGAPARAGPERDGPGGGRRCGHDPALVDDHDAAVQPLLDFDAGPSVAGPVAVGQELERLAVEVDGVVVGHGAQLLEAQDRIKGDARRQWAIGRFPLGRRHAELPIVSRQEVPEHPVGLLDAR